MNWLHMKRAKTDLRGQIDWNSSHLPAHIAIMMDGNGRWATRRGLPRSAGHYAGMQTMRETIGICRRNGIESLTLYAFSTENWKRPKDEVEYIIGLVDEFVQDPNIRELNANNIRIDFIGDLSRFPDTTQDAMRKAVAMTASNGGLKVFFAMNYGGKSDIIRAAKSMLAANEEFTEEAFERFLYTGQNPAPDLLIRTSGEKRLSNFLLWQTAHTELWFTDEMWPDFNEELFCRSLLDYQKRKKRA